MIKIFVICAVLFGIEGRPQNIMKQEPGLIPQAMSDGTKEDSGSSRTGRMFGLSSPYNIPQSGQFYPMQIGYNSVPSQYGQPLYQAPYPSIYGNGYNGYPNYYRPPVYGQSANYLQSYENYYRKNNKDEGIIN